eukprot:8786787-Ditylum_brightwellii.AAC.1
MLGHFIKTFFKVGHHLGSACYLRLFEDRQCVTSEKGLRNGITWRALSDVLTLKYRGQTMSEQNLLFRASLLKER